MFLLRMMVGFLVLGALLILPRPGLAQEANAPWVFVPVMEDGQDLPSWASRAVDQLAGSAVELGLSVWTREQAAATFELRHSSERELIGPEDVRTLQRLGEAAVRSMAAADYLTAQKQLDTAHQHYDKAPDEFNREVPTVVLDLCLHRALAMLQTSTPVTQVREQIRDCRMRIPLDIEPNLMKHTNPIIRQLLAEVSAELLSQQAGVLEVRGKDGCQLRINGIDSGVVSGGRLEGRALARGKHRVSLVCPQGRARVYTVEVDDRTPFVTIDSDFDATVRSRPYLWMGLKRGAVTNISDYASVLGRALDNAIVVLIRTGADGKTILQRMSREGPFSEAELTAPSQVGDPWASEAALAALEQLRHATPHRAKGPLSQAGTPSEEPSRHLGSRSLRRAYWVMGFGVAFHATGVALHLRARSLRADDQAAYDAFLLHEPGGPSKYDHKAARLGLASVVAGVAGNFTFGALAVPLTERYRAGKSNVLPLLGIAGAGGALLGLGLWQNQRANSACHGDEPCRAARDNHKELALLLTGAATNLFAVTLGTGLFLYLPDRIALRRQGVRLTAGAGSVSLEGNF